jgi:hypothetical protein
VHLYFYLQNVDKSIMKICVICKLPRDDFHKHPTTKDGLQPACRQCNKERSKAYYAQNKLHHQQVIGERNRKLQEIARNLLDAYKRQTGCGLCPENEPVCLDFHHCSGKDENVSRLVGQCSLRRAEREIEKCSLLCANCHRKLHDGLIASERIANMKLCSFSFGQIAVCSDQHKTTVG